MLETISEQLHKRTRPEKEQNKVKNVVTADLVIIPHQCPLLESQYLDNLREVDKFLSRKGISIIPAAQ